MHRYARKNVIGTQRAFQYAAAVDRLKATSNTFLGLVERSLLIKNLRDNTRGQRREAAIRLAYSLGPLQGIQRQPLRRRQPQLLEFDRRFDTKIDYSCHCVPLR